MRDMVGYLTLSHIWLIWPFLRDPACWWHASPGVWRGALALHASPGVWRGALVLHASPGVWRGALVLYAGLLDSSRR